MVAYDSLVVRLVRLVDRIPLPAPAPRRGRPVVYPDRLFLKAVVVMVLKRLPTVHSLLAVLDQGTPEMRQLRQLLCEGGRFPSRRTWERRLAALPPALPAQIACLGDHLLHELAPFADHGRAVAIDSTPLRASGPPWHQKDRRAGVVPQPNIDTEAHWTKSGWHGWVYGWKLHLVVTVAGVWLPLRASLTPANTADNTQALHLLADLPPAIRYILGDSQYQDPALRAQAAGTDQVLIAPRRGGTYPRPDPGAPVRQVFHRLRTATIESFNGQFKAIFDGRRPVPTRGLAATGRLVLGAVFVYQLTLLARAEDQAPLRQGLKPFLQAA
jgi:hypothetical protein